MSKKKSVVEKVKDAVTKTTKKVEKSAKSVAKQQLLRDANTGVFYEGKAPKGKSPSGTMGGEPYWEV
jgi:hypothetical protein